MNTMFNEFKLAFGILALIIFRSNSNSNDEKLFSLVSKRIILRKKALKKKKAKTKDEINGENVSEPWCVR